MEGYPSLTSRLKAELTEAKLMLDMYKTAPKEQRDKVELMATETRLKHELIKTKEQLEKTKEQLERAKAQLNDAALKTTTTAATNTQRQRRGSHDSTGSTADDDQPPQPSPVQKKLKKLEEDVGHLEKCLAAKEQEETMLLKEMEVRLRSERGEIRLGNSY